MQKHYDMSQVARYMDYVAYNNYPVWGGQKEPLKPHEIAFGLDYMRGLKQQNFWVTEAIMGAQGHDVTGYLPRLDQAKLWSYQAMAHGCDQLMYFRYRGATKGAEQFCYGILDADNVKRRKYREVQSFFNEIKQYERALSAPICNEVCMVYDYDDMATFRIQRQSILLNYEEELKKMYRPFFEWNIGVDVIASNKDFSSYKVVLMPLMTVWKEKTLKRIKDYVSKGGIVVFTYRTAVKDVHNNLTLGELLPNYLTDLTGIYITETESLQEVDCLKLMGEGTLQGEEGTAGVFREMIETTTAKVLYRYDDFFLQGVCGGHSE